MDGQAPVEIFWTGGWDSTFRVLSLLLEHRLPVAPIYLLDRTRPSMQIEIDTMDRIRAALAEAHPETRAMLLPTTMSEVTDIAPDADIQAAGDRLAAQRGIGNQYAWLARYCKQHGKHEIELCAEYGRHTGAGIVMQDNIAPAMSPHGYPIHRVPPDAPNHDAYLVFGAFAFGMIKVSRHEMVDVVKRNGWSKLMGLTWFCHRPVGNQRPCGLCNPCMNAIRDGFGWRIPLGRRALSAVYRVTVRPLRAKARQLVLRRRLVAQDR
jgi:hypothetical protein